MSGPWPGGFVWQEGARNDSSIHIFIISWGIFQNWRTDQFHLISGWLQTNFIQFFLVISPCFPHKNGEFLIVSPDLLDRRLCQWNLPLLKDFHEVPQVLLVAQQGLQWVHPTRPKGRWQSQRGLKTIENNRKHLQVGLSENRVYSQL